MGTFYSYGCRVRDCNYSLSRVLRTLCVCVFVCMCIRVCPSLLISVTGPQGEIVREHNLTFCRTYIFFFIIFSIYWTTTGLV